MNNTIPGLVVVATALIACGAQGPDTEQQHHSSTSRIVEGSAEAIGAVRFLNDATTTLSVLDHDVPLPSNAAGNLLAHRDGADGKLGTGDDDLFDDIAEILSVKQIGEKRLAAIVAFAEGAGFVPAPGDPLGVYDGVSFTVAQGEATLALVNSATDTTLDDDVALDKRAVASILAARSIGSLLELSQLYYVGRDALTKLRDWSSPALAGEGDDCASTAACVAGSNCIGIPYDGSPAIGRCADISSRPGENDDCGQYSGACDEGLQCAGITVYGGEGYCRPSYMWGTYETKTTVAIPDDDPVGASVDVVVYGLASVPEDIMVTLWIDHPRPQDLVVTLSSTNGSSDVLWNHDASPDYYLPSLGIERDNEVNGRFTINVVDTVAGETGTLGGFKLLVSSRWD